MNRVAPATSPSEMSPIAAGVLSASEALTPRRVAALDGLRAIAVLMVVVMHYFVVVPRPEGATLHTGLQQLGSLGFTGVDLFFVLSGYFIGGILLDFRASPRLLPAFYARRFFRIVPLYLLVLASFFLAREITSLAVLNFGTYFTSPVPVWSYTVFAQNVMMASVRDIGPYWLGATWSLAVEEQFYLLMPLVVLRLTRRQLISVCIAGIVVSPLIRFIALHYAQNTLAAVFLLPSRADGLLLGVLCAAAVRDSGAMQFLTKHGARLGRCLAVALVGLVAMSWQNLAADSSAMVAWGYSAVSVFFAALVLQVATAPDSLLARCLSIQPLAAIGLGSYFIYLFHTPVFYVLHWAVRGRPPSNATWLGGGVTLLALVVTLALAALSWRWFEAPLLRFARRRFHYA